MALEHLEPAKLVETWEESTARGEVFTEAQASPGTSSLHQGIITNDTPSHQQNVGFRLASGRSLLRHAGTWEGGDLEECLTAVYTMRGRVEP